MGSLFSMRTRASFELPLVPAFILGSALAAIFYGLLVYEVLDNALLRRYCLCHPVAVASTWLFFIAVVGMAIKFRNASGQNRVTHRVGQALDTLIMEGHEIARPQRSLWMEARWLALPAAQRDSWVGRRIAEILERQIKRGKHSMLENDIRELAEADSNSQHDSYSAVRIISWAMPMLGFLGTVIGISDTLGRLDTEMLASQSQEALKQMTSGLFVAFDTTAIALVLTITAIFVQFTVSRFETNLLTAMDEVARDNLIEFLGSDARQVEQDLLAPVRQMADDLIGAVHQLVQEQANIWSRTITETQKQWMNGARESSQSLQQAICQSLDHSLTQHAQEIDRIQQEAGRQIDARWQQWQITLSDQARVMHAQQKELVRQTEAIERLVASAGDLKKVEEVIQECFGSVHLIEQLRQSTLGVGEAVAVLATSLERSGLIRGAPVKPRVRRFDEDKDTDDNAGQSRKAA